MSLARKLYELQQIEQEIQKQQKILSEINLRLSENTPLLQARKEFSTLKSHMDQKEKQQRDLEWQIDDLENNVKLISSKLYGGTIKNPKELVSLEKEIEILRSRIKQAEEELLEVMTEIEKMRHEMNTSQEQLKQLEIKWQAEHKILTEKQAEIEVQLAQLEQRRNNMAAQIDPQSLETYRNLKLRKGQAVAKVEQGKCQGCHITLPVSEWHKVRTGNLAYCSSCGRILFLG